MNRGILFDLDDTLTDRAASISEYAQRFCTDFAAKLDGVSPAQVESTVQAFDDRGYAPRERVVAGLLDNLPWRRTSLPDQSHLVTHWQTAFPSSTVGRSGFADVMARLKTLGFVLGVVTNGGTVMQEAKLDRLGIRGLLTCWIVSEAVGVKKPDVRIFRQAANNLACSPEDVYYVGDHPQNDILGAAAAGLEPIWLSGIHPWPSGTPLPRHSIKRLHELLAIVRDDNGTAA